MNRFLSLLAVLPAVIAAPTRRQEPEIIPDQFLIQAAPGQSFEALVADVASVLNVTDFTPDQEFHIGGFEGLRINAPQEVADRINALDSVERIEQDVMVEIQAVVSQPNPPYGLARISSRTRGSTSYRYDDSAGAGTFVYIMDTGINLGHQDFGGRASFGFSAVTNEANGDFNGHGTHCAGTAAGTRFGVAKRASIIDVKVIDGTGRSPLSNLVAGMDWAGRDITSKGRVGRAVVSMSLGADNRQGDATFLDRGAQALVNQGIFVAVASGNSNVNANVFSPARAPDVCTVGATDSSDRRASFSNFGAGVDVLAPGKMACLWCKRLLLTRIFPIQVCK